MITQTLVHPPARLLRALGVCLLLTLLVPLLNWELVFARLIVVEDALATTRELSGHQALFRLGLVVQVAIAFGAVGMGCLLYMLLKPVSPGLSLLALSMRLVEAALISTLALLGLIALQLLRAAPVLGTTAAELVEGFVGVFLQGYMALWSIAMVFFALGTILSFALLCRSGYLSPGFARCGVFAYTAVLLMALLTLLAPDSSAHPLLQAVCYAPSVSFELIGGAWLVWRGGRLGVVAT